jgi:hypothetical protein
VRARSPVLGYNHNVRYAGRIWHVQTEDSGVQNPHIFTHLFHNGTILATKRVDYDAAAEVPAVQKLMQTQHKAMLRELKAGSFDDKIEKFFGEPVVRDDKEERTDPSARLPIVELEAEPETQTDPELQALSTIADALLDERADTPVDSPALPLAPTQLAMDKQAPEPLTRPAPGPPPSRAQPPARPSAAPPPPAPSTIPMRPSRPTPVPRPAVGGIGGLRRPSSSGFATSRPSAEGVVVARPAVIVGGDGQRAAPAAERRAGVPDRRTPAPPPPTTADRRVPGAPDDRRVPVAAAPQPPPGQSQESIFGADLISEKSLDEVILAYLSEDLTEK